jgi:hypothetical protein
MADSFDERRRFLTTPIDQELKRSHSNQDCSWCQLLFLVGIFWVKREASLLSEQVLSTAVLPESLLGASHPSSARRCNKIMAGAFIETCFVHSGGNTVQDLEAQGMRHFSMIGLPNGTMATKRIDGNCF